MAKWKKTVAEPPPVQKPQGKGGKKGSPTSSFDPAAGQDIYEPERILAERLTWVGDGGVRGGMHDRAKKGVVPGILM